MTAGEEGEKPSRSSPTVKPPGEAKALDLLQQHASQYKSKSPSIQDKTLHERERDRERERERDRDGDRPRSSPSQRILPSHHHLGYPLLSGQYDLSYASGETVGTQMPQFNAWPELLSPTLLSHMTLGVKVPPQSLTQSWKQKKLKGTFPCVQSVFV